MLLRRVIGHVHDQNWTAIALDFFIVVSGVFIGIQLGNWNDSRQVRASFHAAQERLQAEHTANLQTVDAFLEQTRTAQNIARDAIGLLRDCSGADDAGIRVNRGANAIRGTATLRLRRTALSAITGNEAYLALLPETDRENLKEFQRRLEQAQSTLDWLEARPFTNNIESYPLARYSDLAPLPGYGDAAIRTLQFDAPFTVLCQDSALLAPFYLWERTSTFQLIRGQQVRDWIEDQAEMEESE